MNEEMMAHTFVVESMTVEAGRIIPSPALAEAVIGGIAQIIAERDELRAECDRLRNINQTYEAENRVQRAERDAAQAEAAKYKALWDAIPWNDLRAVHWHMPIGAPVQPFKRVDVWLKNNAPQPEQEPQP